MAKDTVKTKADIAPAPPRGGVRKAVAAGTKEGFLPGQKHSTPPEDDTLRRFYTSLLEQKPDSEMAFKWCLERGLLPRSMLDLHIAQQGIAGMRIARCGGEKKAPSKKKAAAAADKLVDGIARMAVDGKKKKGAVR